MTCPICSLYFQDAEQEAFRDHALSRHDPVAVVEALNSRGIAWSTHRTSLEREPRKRPLPDGE